MRTTSAVTATCGGDCAAEGPATNAGKAGGAVQPSSTRGTRSGQAFSRARRPWARQAAAYAWLCTVASVAMTRTSSVFDALRAASAPGSITPITETEEGTASLMASSAKALAVLQAMTRDR